MNIVNWLNNVNEGRRERGDGKKEVNHVNWLNMVNG